MAKIPQGHVRQRKDGSWEDQYNYQRRKRSIYGKSEIEARTRLSRIMASIREGNYFHPNGYMVSSWIYNARHVWPYIRFQEKDFDVHVQLTASDNTIKTCPVHKRYGIILCCNTKVYPA